MSPEPYVRGQAFALAALLVATAVLDSGAAALACAIVTGLGAWILRARYRGDLLASHVVEVPAHRERLDLIVAGDVRSAVATGGVAGGLLLGFDVHRPDAGVAPITPLFLTIIAAGVLLSSLVDWYVILPRISGLLGARPCRDAERDHPRFPKTWRETTRWWYIHRIIAALILRFGLSYAIARTVVHHISLPHGTSIVTSAATTLFASYLWASGQAVWEAGHLTLILGRTVRRHHVTRKARTVTILGSKLSLPFLPKRREIGALIAREYVYDVSLESVQLVPAAQRERRIPLDENGTVVYERDPRKLPVRDAQASEPEPARAYHGCKDVCAGINWYCIENPRCFAPK